MPSQDKPNVIFVLCDQLRALEVGCYGNDVVRTPNMDKLAASGVRFNIACSNNPVCSPGRSILLSGQYSRTCMGHLGNVPEPVRDRYQLKDQTVAESFKQAGYHTALIGKWHIGPVPEAVGFDFTVYPKVSHRYTQQVFVNEQGERFRYYDYSYLYEQEVLANYIEQHSREPFFLYYNISQPHMPVIDCPERYRTMYPRESVRLRENVWRDGKMARDEDWFRTYLWDYLYYAEHLPHTDIPLDDFDLRDLTALYCGLTTWADDQLGNLMRLLEANGIAENTLVVFTSDHGDNLGSHQLFNKDELYEEAMRIPMIYHWPAGLAPRTADSQVTSLVDVMPTALSLAGLDVPGCVQGTNVSPVVRGVEASVGENCAFIENSPGHVGIRTLTHTYGVQKAKQLHPLRTTHVTDPDFMCFDVPADPFELNNLAKSPKRPAIADSLRDRVLKWDAETKWTPTG